MECIDMTKRLVGTLVVVLTGLMALPVAAQVPTSVRVISRGAQILSRPAADAQIVFTAVMGTTLDVLDADQGWYWVSVPADRSDGRRRGWIRTRDVGPVNAADDSQVVRDSNQKIDQPQQQPPAMRNRPRATAVSSPRHSEDSVERARQLLERRQEEYQAAQRGFAAPSHQAPTGPRYDAFGGYTWLWDSTDSISFPLGWVASIAGRVTDSVSIVGEAGGNYKSASVLGVNLASASIYTFTGGPKFSGQAGSVRPFGQVLAGLEVGHVSALGYGASSTGFAVMPGFGVDLPVANRLGVRIGGEFGFIHDSLGWSNGFKLMTGLVVTGGAR
jgi:hypothetical protein